MISAVPDGLVRVRDAVLPSLDAALDRLHPDMAVIARYHLGLVDPDGHPIADPGGKYLRPALALLSAQAAGAPPGEGVPGAVAVELVHDFSLLHDDVMDGDEQRRHRPTAWKVFGKANAILAGDALLSLAVSVVLEEGGRHAARAARSLNRAVADLVTGQADDLAFATRGVAAPDECLVMCSRKTGALLACSCAIGAELAGASPATVAALHGFGMHLGLAFQAVDDLLGIWGAPGITGKPHSDLRNGKNSLPVCFAVASDPRGPLEGLAGRPLGEEEAATAAGLIEAAGGRLLTERCAEREIELALDTLAAASVAEEARAGFAELAGFITERGL